MARTLLHWTASGRVELESDGQHTWTGGAGERNVLVDGQWLPHHWDGERLHYGGDRSVRVDGSDLVFERGGSEEARTSLELRKSDKQTVDAELAAVAVEVFDTTQHGATLTLVLASSDGEDECRHSVRVDGSETLVASLSLTRGGKSKTKHVALRHKAVVDNWAVLCLPDELPLRSMTPGSKGRGILRSEEKAFPKVSGQSAAETKRQATLEPLPAAKRDPQTDEPGGELEFEWTAEIVEDGVSPDTYGPATATLAGVYECGASYYANEYGGSGSGYGCYLDENSDQDQAGVVFWSVTMSGTITSATLTCARQDQNNGTNGTCGLRCEQSNTPAAPSSGANPWARTYRAAEVACNFPNSSATQVFDIVSLLNDLIGAGYTYTGGSTQGVHFAFAAGNKGWLDGGTAVSWRSILNGSSGTRPALSITYTPASGGTINADASATGAATVSAVVSGSGQAAGSASGSGGVTADGSVDASGSAAATGSAAVAGGAASAGAVDADASGAGAAAASGNGLAQADATATGAATVSATGASTGPSTVTADGSATGTSTVAATGGGTGDVTGAASGASDAAVVAGAIAAADAVASGSASVAATGSVAGGESSGALASGQATVSAGGVAYSEAHAQVDGASAVTAGGSASTQATGGTSGAGSGSASGRVDGTAHTQAAGAATVVASGEVIASAGDRASAAAAGAAAVSAKTSATNAAAASAGGVGVAAVTGAVVAPRNPEAVIETVLESVVGLLEAKFGAAADVRRWPDKTEMRIAHPKCAIWVGYGSSKYSEPFELSMMAQDRMMTIAMAVIVRNLHGPHGAGNYLDGIRVALHGRTLPVGGTPLQMLTEDFGRTSNGLWQYNTGVRFTVPAIAVTPIAPEVPRLVHLTIEDSLGEATDLYSTAD